MQQTEVIEYLLALLDEQLQQVDDRLYIHLLHLELLQQLQIEVLQLILDFLCFSNKI